ncbi:MAG: acetyl-CoA carboxylase biotin carboxyl carrier protein [Chitinophagales bacterium]|nr:acetyl-CoA carboxylase biotin carboxyl carrier protein [Chitinophagales bacterium]
MDFKEIQELIRMLNKHSIAELTVENQDFKLKIKTALAGSQGVTQMHVLPQLQHSVIQSPVAEKHPVVTPEIPKKSDSAVESESLITIKSPIVGTFYRSAGPDKEVFVKVGDEITVGSVLCIIEAMKLFNEIESEHSGKIVKILVDDASPVEFDQPLFLVEPK